MIEVWETTAFRGWLDGLRDRRAKARIAIRINRLARAIQVTPNRSEGALSKRGLIMDRAIGSNFTRRAERIILLLSGGDKSTQARDIAEAKALAKELNK